MLINPLSNVPLFSDFPRDELDHLLSALGTIRLKSGEMLFHEGDLSEHLYVVINGVLEVLRAANTDEEMILGIVGKGDYFGQGSLIVSDALRSASVRARGDVVLLSMSHQQFIELLQRNPLLAYSMIKVISTGANESGMATYRELEVARDIQMSIMPDSLPVHDKFDFGGRILPARQVGGDFYDVFDLGDNKVGVLIGDVADKGVPSAIFMARTHAFIIAEADNAITPAEVLRMANKHITHLEKSTQFVTVLYGMLDLNTREFSYARAGHEPPLLLEADGNVHRLPHQQGMALGLWEDIVLDENRIIMANDSLLVMFTDGMTDCRNSKGEPFGLERIKSALSAMKAFNAQSGCDQLFDTLMAYQNGSKQDDDVTLVAVHAK